jgi:hypothetical protein
VKKRLCMLDAALAGVTVLHCSAIAGTANPSSIPAAPANSSARTNSNEQDSKRVVEECENEWRANRDLMVERDMDEDSYVAQCSVKDDVPAISSEPNPNAAPSPVPK